MQENSTFLDLNTVINPNIRIKSLHLNKMKVYEDYKFVFNDKFMVFVGPNGCGKTTILDAIQTIFMRYDGYTGDRLKLLFDKLNRHGDDQFTITAEITSDIDDYEVVLNNSGFIKDHPNEIKAILMRLCYYAKFDQDFNKFQLHATKWDLFKDLFDSITGFNIELKDNFTKDKNLKDYVFNFIVHKPNESIKHEECSAGERKIIKCFSTLLNKEYNPNVVLIDNAELHIELGRHINFFNALQRCFPKSQIFTTTHSYNIARNMKEKNLIYDLRIVRANDIIKNDPWRLMIIDELKSSIDKLNGMTIDCKNMLNVGNDLIDRLHNRANFDFKDECTKYLSDVSYLFIDNILQNNKIPNVVI